MSFPADPADPADPAEISWKPQKMMIFVRTQANAACVEHGIDSSQHKSYTRMMIIQRFWHFRPENGTQNLNMSAIAPFEALGPGKRSPGSHFLVFMPPVP